MAALGGQSFRKTASALAGWGGLAFVALTSASEGFSVFAVMVGLYVLVVGVIALARGRVSWARLGSRATGGVAVGAALVLLMVGAIVDAEEAPQSPSTTAEVATTSSATPTTSDAATPTPAETTTDETPTEPVMAALELTCEGGGGDETFPSLKAAWAYDGSVYRCTATVNLDTYAPSGAAVAAARGYEKSGEYSGETGATGALEDLLAVCAARDEDVTGFLDNDRAKVPHALRICPSAPQAPLMRAVLAKEVFVDGNLVVGKDVKPGTYRTADRGEPGQAEVRDCYWERTTKGGSTIANDFVTFAAKGVTVTIRSSDGGFSSSNCGTWLRVT